MMTMRTPPSLSIVVKRMVMMDDAVGVAGVEVVVTVTSKKRMIER